ncbi:MAG: hypothetical protein RLZZ444_1228 [Pseudomonadota bacterium]|jgi:phage protein U
MLAAIGMFVFSTDTALFDELARRRDWRHARTERFGARPASQYLGPGEDLVTLSGTLVPELAGSYSAIERLAEMADQGEAWPLADGRGNVLGNFTIERIEERHSSLIDTGQARVVGFTIELARVD